MSSSLCDAMRRRFGWLAIPFVFGDINVTDKVIGSDNAVHQCQDSDQDCQRTKPVYNGMVASMNFFFFMTSSLFAVCLVPLLKSTLNKNVILDNVSVEIILIIVMVVGFLVVLLFIIFREKVTVIQGSSIFKGVDRLMYAIGLIIFFLSGCILDLFHVIAKVTCDHVWRSCDREIYKAYTIDVVFYLTKIIYLGGSVLFTLVFYSSKFLNSCLVRYGLMFLLSTHLAIWFDLFVHQSHHLMGTKQERTQLRNLTYYCNVSEAVSNLTTQWQCINFATPICKMLENKVVRVCYPLSFPRFHVDHWAFPALVS